MKAFVPLFLFLALPFGGFGKPLKVDVSAESAILINSKTGAVLFEKNAHTPLYPASITKIATALYVLKHHGEKLNEKVAAKQEAIASITPSAKRQSNYRSPPHWLETDGTHIGIKKGEELRLHDLLYALMLSSANDAANVIAQMAGGTIPKFMEKLNVYLKEIGCKNTYFCNPHGLHHPNHKTTAYDMAVMAREAMKIPTFRKIVSTTRHKIPETNIQEERTLVQTNLLLQKGRHHYPKAKGIKTGTTSVAGRTLVGAAEDENRSLVAVVMGQQTKRYEDMIKLFDAAFNEPKMRRTLLAKGAQKFSTHIEGAKTPLKTFLPDGLHYDFYASEDLPVKVVVEWKKGQLPIKKGDFVGVARVVQSSNVVVKEAKVYALNDVNATLLHRMRSEIFWKLKQKKWVFAACGTTLLALFYFLRKRGRPTNRRSY